MTSAIDEIPGIGKTRRMQLLRHFGSLAALKSATVEQIAEVEGFGPTIAAKVFAGLRPPAE